MNILELCLSPALGGLELYHLRTSQFLSNTDSVTAVIHPGGRLKTIFEKAAISFITESAGFSPLPLAAARRIAALIDRQAIDVVHVHWGKDFPLAALSKWFSKTRPRLIYTRQMKITRSKNDLYHNFLYSQMDKMLCITDKLAGEARGFLNPRDVHKVARLYYGVEAPASFMDEDRRREIRRSLGIDDAAFLVGLFGRIEEAKGQAVLIDALALAKAKDVSIGGLIVGHAMQEDYLQKLKKRVEQSHLHQEIVFKDFVDQPQAWMQVCDCVALATQEETFDLVLAEAMRAGVAVIGSDSGGVPEIIGHEKTGLLFRPGDSEALYRGLKRYQDDRGFREKMAASGKEKADWLFDPQRHYRALRDFMAGGPGAIQSDGA